MIGDMARIISVRWEVMMLFCHGWMVDVKEEESSFVP